MKRNEYIEKYKEIYEDIPSKSEKKRDDLITKLADVLVMMDSCKEHIDKEGCVTSMCQGNYDIDRENPWSKVYDAKVKLMISLIEKLDKLVPDSKAQSVDVAGAKLQAFISKGKSA